MPFLAWVKRETPAEWRMTNRPLSPVRRSGPGVAVQTAPSSSSRMKMASLVGSLMGSLANGVRRFSRLLSAQV
jgi:hypothetical protein